jgi:IS30 family transposase
MKYKHLSKGERYQIYALRSWFVILVLGKEFAGHSLIDQELNSTPYFARPFASWERGSNENLNGLLRQ